MKTNNIILLAAAALLFVNCAREEIDAPFKTGTAVAVMETEDTKSNVTDNGYFTWTAGDKIAIHTNDGTILAGTLSQGENTPIGTFSYSYVEGQNPTGYAMYPYSESHKVNDDGVVTFHMPAEYNLGEAMSNTNAPMLAVPTARSGEGSANYSFSHLGGVIRFVIKNAPEGTDKFTLSLGSCKINGDFTVEGGKITTSEAEEGENLTTLNFTALTSVQDITLFVPVPTGNYTGIEAMLYKGDKELGKWGSETAKNNIERRALVLMAPIIFSNTGGNIENDQQVSSPAELAAAVANGGTVTVTEGITLDQEVVIPEGKEVVLNLNGNTINAASSIKVSEGATLSIVNNGQPVYVKSGESSVSCGIVSENDIIVASKDATINIGEGVSLYSTKYCAVFIPSGAEGVTLNTSGDLKAGAEYSAVYVNGNVKTGTINIIGGSISNDNDVAVYIAGNSDVTVSGDVEITGTTAMEVRAGKLTVNGGKFVATAEPSEYTPNGNGTTSKGVALAVCKHSTTENSLVVEINGGEFTGAKSLLVNTDLGPVSLTVNGGTFSDPTPCYYLGDNADVTVKMTEDYTGPGFKVKSGQKVSLNLAEKKYTVTAPLVGSPGTQTLGFQFLQGAEVGISSGEITSSAAKMLIQNYANLTLESVKLTPTVANLDMMKNNSGNLQAYYVLSNNSGKVNINGNTTITAPVLTGLTAYAFDVCKYSTYDEPTVVWASSGKVDGDIELSGGTFTVKESLDLTGVIKVTGTSKVNLDSGTITSGGDVFDVDGGTLTVEGNDDTKVIAKSGVGSTSAVWVHNNGAATINGGHYSVGADKDGLRNDCIYAGSKSEQSTGTIIINGGKFEYTGGKSDENAKDGDLFLINRADTATESLITVNGGTFKNHVPGCEPTEPDNKSGVTLGENKKVVKTNGEEEVEVTTAHTGDTDVWYTVK